MFKIVCEYKGSITNGIVIVGEVFYPGVKRTIRVDREKLAFLTEACKNGWFTIHNCEPKNPFEEEIKVKVEVKEEVVEEAKEVVEEAKEVVEEAKEVVEEVVEEVKEEAPKKKTSRTKKKTTEA